MKDSLALVRCLIANTWNTLLTVQVPGIGISFAALFIGLFIFGVGIKLISIVLGSSTGSASSFLESIDRHKKGE